jgi:flagellum-specific peptidoglycan hydrolase FlgJ
VRFDAGVSQFSADIPVPMAHLAAWLQVASTTASLYRADAGSSILTSDLPRNTFLRVLGPGTARLQVQALDDNGRPGPTGWVDPDDVLPSAPGTDWLVAAHPTPLSHADGTTRQLDQFTPVQQFDGPVQGRIEVRVFSPDFSQVVDQGWIDASDTGVALPPQTRVPASSSASPGRRVPSGVDPKQSFLAAVEPAAIAARRQTAVPASVTVAQAILESDWGRSALATGASNYFGMKALGGLGNDGVVWLSTSEFDDDGQEYDTVSPFRAYKSLSDSILDHDRLLTTLSRYAPAMQAANDPQQFAEMLAQGGYSTDPDYADKLVALMDSYDLYSLDG